MITEDYVSFEIAKLLKEKGFNEKVSRWYVTNFPEEGTVPFSFGDETEYTQAPTLQMTMKWLREEKKLNCIIDVSFNQNRNGEVEYYFSVWENNPPYELLRESTQTFSIYEEACEAAIKCCLEMI